MFYFGMIVGAVIVAAIWIGVSWYKNRKAQIKEKVVNIINKV